VIFIDSNIPMYLVGAAHANKATAQILLESLIARGERLVTDAEVLQEILHRYTAINRRDAIDPAIQLTLSVVDEVFSVEKRDVLRASEITRSHTALSARDALHIAIIERQRVRSILSFDSDFDHWPALRRYHEI
jgi:predicted nucleic acid-binding protein